MTGPHKWFPCRLTCPINSPKHTRPKANNLTAAPLEERPDSGAGEGWLNACNWVLAAANLPTRSSPEGAVPGTILRPQSGRCSIVNCVQASVRPHQFGACSCYVPTGRRLYYPAQVSCKVEVARMGYEAVRSVGIGWPEGLTDLEAVQRLRTSCLGGCDGIQDLADDSRYKALRPALLNRTGLRPLAPAFIAAQSNLSAYVRYVRETKDRNERRDMVRAQFRVVAGSCRRVSADPTVGVDGQAVPPRAGVGRKGTSGSGADCHRTADRQRDAADGCR